MKFEKKLLNVAPWGIITLIDNFGCLFKLGGYVQKGCQIISTMNSYQPAHGAWVKNNIKQQSWCNVKITTLSKIYQANVQHKRLSDSYQIYFFLSSIVQLNFLFMCPIGIYNVSIYFKGRSLRPCVLPFYLTFYQQL